MDIRQFVRSINSYHPLKKGDWGDWQEISFIDFHNRFTKNEQILRCDQSYKIVTKFSRRWKIQVNQLYPKEESAEGYSWAATLGPRHGVIWIDPDMMYPSHLFHELAHLLVESFITYDLKGKSRLREEGHGVLFSEVLYNLLKEHYGDSVKHLEHLENCFKASNIFMAEGQYDAFFDFFCSRKLLKRG